MISASALEAHAAPLSQSFHDGYLMKPIDIPRLLERIGHLLKVEWQHVSAKVAAPVWNPTSELPPPAEQIEALVALGQLGHVRAIQARLDEIERSDPRLAPFVSRLRGMVDRFDLNGFMTALEAPATHER